MKYEDNHKIGKLVAVEDHGTTVSIWVDHDEPIPIDWRMFNAIVECEGPDLIGRSVDYNIEDDLTITVKTSSGQMIVINKDEII